MINTRARDIAETNNTLMPYGVCELPDSSPNTEKYNILIRRLNIKQIYFKLSLKKLPLRKSL